MCESKHSPPDWLSAAAHVIQVGKPGDLVLFSSKTCTLAWLEGFQSFFSEGVSSSAFTAV